MYRIDKSILIILIVCLAAVISGTIGTYLAAPALHRYFEIASYLGKISAIYILVQSGSLIRNNVFRLVYIFLAVCIVGALFKIMYWQYGDLILLIGFVCLPIVYSIHFFRKPEKSIKDGVKLIWVILFFAASLFTILHWKYSAELRLAEGIAFVLMVLIFIITQWQIVDRQNPGNNSKSTLDQV